MAKLIPFKPDAERIAQAETDNIQNKPGSNADAETKSKPEPDSKKLESNARPKPKRAKANERPHERHHKRQAKHAAQPSPQSRQLRVRTAEEIANEQTAEQLALQICAALIGEKTLSTMSGLVDELLDAHLLDDDDESWLDDHHKREDKMLDEAIADGLDTYPDINAINNLPPPADAGRRGRYGGPASHQHLKVLLQLVGAERQVRIDREAIEQI